MLYSKQCFTFTTHCTDLQEPCFDHLLSLLEVAGPHDAALAATTLAVAADFGADRVQVGPCRVAQGLLALTVIAVPDACPDSCYLAAATGAGTVCVPWALLGCSDVCGAQATHKPCSGAHCCSSHRLRWCVRSLCARNCAAGANHFLSNWKYTLDLWSAMMHHCNASF